MKRTPMPTRLESLRESTARKARERLEQGERPKTTRTTRRAISPASKAQRGKVRDAYCIVTGLDRYDEPIDPAHLTSRGFRGGCDDPLCVVPLARHSAHRPFDDGQLSLLEHLRPFGSERCFLPEILHALDHYDGDLISLLERLTGQRWQAAETTP